MTRKQTCVYTAVVPGEQPASLKENRQAAFPTSSSMSSLANKAGGQLRGIGPKRKSLGVGRKKRNSSEEDDEDQFDEPVKEIAPGRIIVVVGSASGRARSHKEDHSSSGQSQSSTSSPTPLTPRSASDADWDRSPYHAHSHLHPNPPAKIATTPRTGYPSVVNGPASSNPSSPSSYASSLPAMSARTSPNVGPGGALPEPGPAPRWVPSWMPTATSPYFPSVLMGTPYAYEDSVSLDRDHQTVVPSGPSSSPSSARSHAPTVYQQQQQRVRQRALQGMAPPSTFGSHSVLGIYQPSNGSSATLQPPVGQSVVLGSEVPLYAYPASSSSPHGLAPPQITPDIYQAPLPEYEVPIDFSFLRHPHASSSASHDPHGAFDHYRSTSSHSTSSNFSDVTSSVVDDNELVYLPDTASFVSSSSASSHRVRSQSSTGAYRPQYSRHASSTRERTQTAGATPYNSSLLADQSALFEGLGGGGGRDPFSLFSLNGGDGRAGEDSDDGDDVGGGGWDTDLLIFRE